MLGDKNILAIAKALALAAVAFAMNIFVRSVVRVRLAVSGDYPLWNAAKAQAIVVAMNGFDRLGWDEGRRAAQEPFSMGSRGAMGASTAVNLVVALVVGGLLSAFLLPIAIDEIVAVDTSSWTNGAAALWDILPVMIVLAIFLFFTGVAIAKSNM